MDFKKFGSLAHLKQRTTVFKQGDPCLNYLLITRGTVKVFTRSDNGREILLYRVNAGETCTLTTTCLLADNTYPAEAICATDVEAVVIPHHDFKNLMNTNEDFRQLVFDSYGKRLKDVITLIEKVSFGRVESRLANWLHDQAKNDEILITHQAIATELGTAREVISRQLKEFERKGWLKLSRGKVAIENKKALLEVSK